MAICDHCGNDYAKSFTLTLEGNTYTFDSFECAITKLAPSCETCGCRVIGHGTDRDGKTYCCNHCADS